MKNTVCVMLGSYGMSLDVVDQICSLPHIDNVGSDPYWIYEKKVTRIPACARCGEESAQGAPEILFRSDYHCAKCLAAMERRNNFLNGITG